MFTGIIEATGHIKAIQAIGGDKRFIIESNTLDYSDVALGDSIATNGVCLTVTDMGANYYAVDVSAESLGLTTLASLKPGVLVNLEKAMLPTTRFGGHIVSGHVDGIGEVVRLESNARATDYYIRIPKELSRYVVKKGSITLDGISLTVNDIEADIVRLTLIPHTQEMTNVSLWQPSVAINVEIDLIARYLEKLLLSDNQHDSSISLSVLANAGFLGK